MQKKIIATINKKTGAITIRTEGYNGAECLNATKKLEDGLGLNTDGREYTPEFYDTTSEQQQQGT